MVGVEDEETGELTLHRAGHAYALRQSVGGRQESVEDHAMEGLEWKERKDALVNQFGSKKKKAAIRCVRPVLCDRRSAEFRPAAGSLFNSRLSRSSRLSLSLRLALWDGDGEPLCPQKYQCVRKSSPSPANPIGDAWGANDFARSLVPAFMGTEIHAPVAEVSPVSTSVSLCLSLFLSLSGSMVLCSCFCEGPETRRQAGRQAVRIREAVFLWLCVFLELLVSRKNGSSSA